MLPICEQFPSMVRPIDSYWLQTSSNEVAPSHLFPPRDGSGSSQLSDRGCGVIRSCENRVIPGEKSKEPGPVLRTAPGSSVWDLTHPRTAGFLKAAVQNRDPRVGIGAPRLCLFYFVLHHYLMDGRGLG